MVIDDTHGHNFTHPGSFLDMHALFTFRLYVVDIRVF